MDPYTGPKDEALFSAIGRLTLSWGLLEAGLAAAIDSIFHLHGNPSREAEIPRALNRKIKFLRKAIPKLAGDGDETRRFLAFLDEVDKETIVRHDIIHGCVVRHEEGTGEALSIRLLHHKTGRVMKPVRLDAETIMQAAVRTNKLAGIALTLARLLSGAEDHEAPRE
jgi:hypothetical protein